MAKEKETAPKKSYVVLRNLRHNLKHYAAKSTIELTDREADDLPTGTVELAKEAK
jgi:hypothetical protein